MTVIRRASGLAVMNGSKAVPREPNRSIKVSRKLSGAIWVEIEGCPGFTLIPDQAFKLAAGIFKGLGIEMQYDWDGIPTE